MKLDLNSIEPLDMSVFLFFGSFVFCAQAVVSLVGFGLNASSGVGWLGFLYTWLSVSFNLVLS